MKTLLIAVLTFALALSAAAQGKAASKEKTKAKIETAPAVKKEATPAAEKTTEEPAKATPAAEKQVPVNEFVSVEKGVLWHTKGTEKTELKEEVTLGGTVVKPDGTVVLKDGTTKKLAEGNVVNIKGSVIDVNALKQKAAQQKALQEQKPEQK